MIQITYRRQRRVGTLKRGADPRLSESSGKSAGCVGYVPQGAAFTAVRCVPGLMVSNDTRHYQLRVISSQYIHDALLS